MPSRTTRSAAGWRIRRVAEVAPGAGADLRSPRTGPQRAGSPSVGSIRDALARGAAELAAAGCDTPRLDAELLLAEALGTDRAQLVIRARDSLPDTAGERYAALLARRRAREPIAYILGRREFRRLTLHVDSRVLIPRPETELLLEVGLSLPHGARVADVGTGSGAVALALKDERPDLAVTGIDLSEAALDVARANGRRLGVEVNWVVGDLLGSGERKDRHKHTFDAVLANLPYVPDGSSLPADVASFEPACALFAGPDGLDLIRRLVPSVASRMQVRLVALEHGAGQGDAIIELLGAAGFDETEQLHDLAGHERVVVARR
jgi:release factor glutamine methyltransferase